jgi:hypothetical protein
MGNVTFWPKILSAFIFKAHPNGFLFIANKTDTDVREPIPNGVHTSMHLTPNGIPANVRNTVRVQHFPENCAQKRKSSLAQSGKFFRVMCSFVPP